MPTWPMKVITKSEINTGILRRSYKHVHYTLISCVPYISAYSSFNSLLFFYTHFKIFYRKRNECSMDSVIDISTIKNHTQQRKTREKHVRSSICFWQLLLQNTFTQFQFRYTLAEEKKKRRKVTKNWKWYVCFELRIQWWFCG